MWGKINKFSKRDIILVVLALIVIVWGVYFYVQNRNNITNNSDAQELSRVEGKFIIGFPKDFIFENNIQPIESTRTKSNTQNLWSASYFSSKTSEEIFSIYKNAIEFLGWEISNSSLNQTLFAKKESMQISLFIQDNASSRKVTVSILEK